MNQILREYGADCLARCETQVDWRFVKEEDDRFKNLFGQGKPRRHVVGFNKTELKSRSQRTQRGGTALMAFEKFSSHVKEANSDPSGLGRWC